MEERKCADAGAIPIRGFLSKLAASGKTRVRIGESEIRVGTADLPLDRLVAKLEKRGVFSPEILAERALAGINLSEEAETLGVTPLELGAVYQAAIDTVPREFVERVREDLARPKGLGELDPDDPDYDRRIKELGIDKIRKASIKELLDWSEHRRFPLLLPRGPLQAVDHRPFLGPARSQGGRGTCTAFGSTCVAEALEYFRDPRFGPRDFAEQLIFWYSKSGQLYTGGGYGCGAALRHHAEYGTCEEFFFPYSTQQLATNHAQVPMSDEAMDRAEYFRTGNVVGIPARDVDAMKAVLRSGRCAGIIHDATDWNTSTGTYTFPDPLDSKGIGGNHCTAIIGYIDRDDLPEVFEGGYFIQRNSWGGAGSTTNVMGPEYGGHLLMPYGWYRRYTHSAYTLEDIDEPTEERKWLVEYFANEILQGAPIEKAEIAISVLGVTFKTSVEVPETVNEVDFDWGSGSALRFPLFPLGTFDALPRDHFSARFTKVKRFRNGWYRFRLRGDDGIRLWVDDALVINAWKPQDATEYVAEHHLTGGDHVLRVEYYERAGDAEVTLDIEAINFTWELFGNTNLSGSPASTFTDTLTDLEWRHAPPVIGPLQNGPFSARARARLTFEGGDYRFHSVHTGGCRIYLDDALVLDDWSGTQPTGPAHTVSAGPHDVRVEFKHEEPVPGVGVQGFYRAALNFGWSNDEWIADFFKDDRREAFAATDPKPDHEYVTWRTLSLTGSSIYRRTYDASHNAAGEYRTTDGIPVSFKVSKPEEFTADVTGAPDLTGHYHSAWIRRRIFVPETGNYNVRYTGGAASRVVVNGKQVLEDHVGSAPSVAEDIFLKAGVHDVALEWSVSKWSKSVDFKMERVGWSVTYYDGTDFDTWAGGQSVDSVAKIIEQRPASVGSSSFSVRATRTVSLPLGRYRFQVRTDDGARLKIDGITRIDAWTNQPATNYAYELEHNGGDVKLELEYYQAWGGSALEFDFKPIGYYAEYYRGTTLQKPPAGSSLDRNVPIAYRFDPAIDFDWGAGNRLDRVGSNDFSARWRGMVDLPVGRWNAVLRSDDGVRLFINGRLLIDEWKTQSPTTHDRRIDLVGRRHEVVVEYFEQSGQAVCQLRFDRLF